MKKYLLIATLIILFSLSNKLSAQMGVSIQAGAAVPTGSLSDVAKLGWGGQANLEYPVIPSLNLSASVGYYLWGAKGDLPEGFDYTLSTIPVLVGAKYLLLEGDFHPYLGADMGVHFMNTKQTIINLGGTKLDTDNSETNFGFAPMAGVRLHMPPNLDLDLNLTYNIITTSGSSTSFIGIIAGALILLQ